MIELFFRIVIDIIFMAIAIYVLRNSDDKENLFCNRLRLGLLIIACRIAYLLYQVVIEIIY